MSTSFDKENHPLNTTVTDRSGVSKGGISDGASVLSISNPNNITHGGDNADKSPGIKKETSQTTLASAASKKMTGTRKRSKSNKKLSKYHKALVKEIEAENTEIKARTSGFEEMKKRFGDMEERMKQLRLAQQNMMDSQGSLL